jgi:hypothetical protein
LKEEEEEEEKEEGARWIEWDLGTGQSASKIVKSYFP